MSVSTPSKRLRYFSRDSTTSGIRIASFNGSDGSITNSMPTVSCTHLGSRKVSRTRVVLVRERFWMTSVVSCPFGTSTGAPPSVRNMVENNLMLSSTPTTTRSPVMALTSTRSPTRKGTPTSRLTPANRDRMKFCAPIPNAIPEMPPKARSGCVSIPATSTMTRIPDTPTMSQVPMELSTGSDLSTPLRRTRGDLDSSVRFISSLLSSNAKLATRAMA
mmetsp:Transcript_40371/g.103375  ORF Transcript_40371/g.103375 Transcript_40371/m.103375 type:complete len:218 (-) Transcript_40371:911-1564(-)